MVTLFIPSVDCKFVGRDRNKVQDHVRTHTQEKQVACPTCGKQFCNNTKLKDHLNRQLEPPGDPAMTCQYCRKKFPNERLLREHTRKHINNVRCPHCGLTCQSEWASFRVPMGFSIDHPGEFYLGSPQRRKVEGGVGGRGKRGRERRGKRRRGGWGGEGEREKRSLSCLLHLIPSL